MEEAAYIDVVSLLQTRFIANQLLGDPGQISTSQYTDAANHINLLWTVYKVSQLAIKRGTYHDGDLRAVKPRVGLMPCTQRPTRLDRTVSSRRVWRCESGIRRRRRRIYLSYNKTIAYQQAGTLTGCKEGINPSMLATYDKS